MKIIRRKSNKPIHYLLANVICLGILAAIYFSEPITPKFLEGVLFVYGVCGTPIIITEVYHYLREKDMFQAYLLVGVIQTFIYLLLNSVDEDPAIKASFVNLNALLGVVVIFKIYSLIYKRITNDELILNLKYSYKVELLDNRKTNWKDTLFTILFGITYFIMMYYISFEPVIPFRNETNY